MGVVGNAVARWRVDVLAVCYELQALAPSSQVRDWCWKFRIIMTTEDAARFLLNQWPIDEGEKLIAARQACLDALEEEVPVMLAREAFIEACEEAGMYVMPT
jgi:hypothetical protein